jgi:demethylspheroidene O-methyltransferase
MDPRFQAFAARFPLTRGVVAKRAEALFDLVGGFVYAKVAAACVELELLERLAPGPMDAGALGALVGLQPQGAETLFKAAAALGLLERLDHGRLALGPQGAALLATPGLRDVITHHGLLYADLNDPVAFFRAGQPGRLAAFWPYAGVQAPHEVGADAAAAYSTLMARTQPMAAAQILAAYPIERARTILDVGGGEGAFLIAAAQKATTSRLVLFDVPAVAARAEKAFRDAGLADRSTVFAGDFHRDSLPPGADLITLVRVLHDHDDEEALALLRKARSALPPGGRLLVAEQMGGRSAVSDAFFNIYLRSMGTGRARAPREVCDMLRAAGLRHVRRIVPPTPLLIELIEARA